MQIFCSQRFICHGGAPRGRKKSSFILLKLASYIWQI